ncbi:extracellular solute-binding protein [Paenibacillus sp. GD4]|uniref:extracellular solute-binding protein n=1 Tax=Paenibacillus sp. GD4 TaxID=3068890 RepID=UPI0027964AD7|nr:extracellular solute-binding protein [Paenibacillus sp. GD4]MDQ1909046.1 extracellular solute-binding protein [Paenibacillus sp. GD4]
MSRKKKAVRIIAGAVLMAFLAAGCQGKNAAVSVPADTPVITMMANLFTTEVPSDRIEKLLEEKTGTRLEIQWVPDDSYEEKLNAAFATGTLPKAAFLKNQTSLLLFKDAIRNDQFWEIGPYLKDYPNLQRLDPQVLSNTAVDGKIYALYKETPTARSGIIYRKDWADRLGLTAPQTINDVYNMLKAFKEKDPDQNGLQDTIGLADRNDLVYGAFKTVASWFGTPNQFAVSGGSIVADFMDPSYMETMKFFKKLHQEGLMNQDFPVTSKNDQQNLLISGKAGMYIGSMGDVVSLHKKMTEVNPRIELDVQNVIQGGPKGYGIWGVPGFGNAVLFPKSAVKTEAELRSLLSFFDKLMTPELGLLIYSGLEGEHYTMKDGKVAPVQDVKLTDKEVKPYQSLQIGGPSTISSLVFYHELPVKQKAEELTIDNGKYLIQDPTLSLDSKTYIEKGARLQEWIKDATYMFILGRMDEAGFRKEVERWKAEGGNEILKEFTLSYQAAKK